LILDILNEIADTPSRNEKEAILKREVNNDLLRRVFFLAYDPFTQFYIRKIPEYERNETSHAASLEGLLPGLQALSSRRATGNAGIYHLQTMLQALNVNDAEVLERIIGKDLKCGASGSTANKVWPGLIAEFPCMLCTPSDEKILSKFKFPAFAQLKMDGMRFNAIVKDGKCEFRSRNGKEINLLGNLEQEFVKLANGQNLVFDGELLVVVEGNIQDRQTGNGILNKAVKGTISAKEAESVHATVWDCIPYHHFVEGKGSTQYLTRFAILESASLPHKIRLVESSVVASLDEAEAIFERYLAQGQEGIILKDMSGIWEDKRVKTQVKFKAELDCDLRVVGIQPGTGKYEGMVGALLCESSDGVIQVDVGSGLSDDDRRRDDYIGKIVAVTYNARIKNKQGKQSLFLPRLIEVRLDKDEADNSEKIK
jgi:ATP-dependent DNA ligase